MAVCHHHATAVLPFCIAGVPIAPVFHLGAAVGDDIPFWDSAMNSPIPIWFRDMMTSAGNQIEEDIR